MALTPVQMDTIMRELDTIQAETERFVEARTRYERVVRGCRDRIVDECLKVDPDDQKPSEKKGDGKPCSASGAR